MAKNSSASNVKQPSSPPSSATVDSASQPPQPPDESLDPVIYRDGLRVVETIKRRNYIKALKMIKKYISCHQESAQLHALEASVHHSLSEKVAKDSSERLKYLTDAVRSAALATEVLPNSIHCASCLVALLYEKALLDGQEWDTVIQVGTSALMITNSTDPGVDKFLLENDMVDSSKESRIEYEKHLIRKYLQLSWSEKNRRVLKGPLQAVPEKSIGQEMVLELERNKMKIETAIRDWCAFKQKKTPYLVDKSEDNDENKVKYKFFWGTLSAEEKRGFFEVSIKGLERHLKSLKCHFAVNLWREAMDFFKEHKTWKCWECSSCHRKFGNCDSYRNHFRGSHFVNIDELEFQSRISGEVKELIENGDWKPVDADVGVMNAVYKIKSASCSTSNRGLDKEALHENKCSSIKDVEGIISKEEKIQDLSGSKCDEHMSSKMSVDDQRQQFCDVTERAMLLESIRRIFRLLLKNKCLAPSFLHWARHYVILQFEDFIPFLRHLGHEIIMVICLLRAPELKMFLEFLKDLTVACGLSENPEIVSPMGDELCCDQVSNIKERVEISEDLSCLLLDRRLFREELNITNEFDGVTCESSAVTSAANVCKNVVLLDSDDFVSWLYKGPMIRDDLESWKSLRDSQRQNSMEVCDILCTEYLLLKNLCSYVIKSKCSLKLEAIETAESIYLEESDKGDKITLSFYVSLLKKKQKELQMNDDSSSTLESDAISDVISDILRNAQADETLAHLSNNQSAFEPSCLEDELKVFDGFQYDRRFIQSTLQMTKLQTIEHLAFAHALMLQSTGAIQQHEMKLEMMSFYDYQLIILTLLKSFLKVQLEDLFNKDDAITKALLAEIDANNTTLVCDNARKKQDKKKKSRKKIFTKNKKLKATDGSKNFQLYQNDAKQGDNTNCELSVSRSADDMEESSITEENHLDGLFENQKELNNESEVERFQADVENAVCVSLAPVHERKNMLYKDEPKKHDTTREAFVPKVQANHTKQIYENTREKQDKKKKIGKKNFRKDNKLKATNGDVDFQLHQTNGEKRDYSNCEIDVSRRAFDMEESTITKENQLDEHSENQKKIKDESAEKRFQADVERAVCLHFVPVHGRKDPLNKDESKKHDASRKAVAAKNDVNYSNQVCDNKREKQDKKKKNRKKKFRNDKKLKATDSHEDFQLHQTDAERQQENPNCEIAVSRSANDMGELSAMKKIHPDEHTENQKKIKNECAEKSFEADVEKAVCLSLVPVDADDIGKSSVTREKHLHEHLEYPKTKNDIAEKRLQAAVEKAVRLSLDSFEKHHERLPADVRNGSMPRFDVQQYVVIQSQWWLRQLRDEAMSRSAIMHTHAGNPCFLCACQDSFAAMRIASRDMPEVAFVPVSSRKFPVNRFFKEWLGSEDLLDKDVGHIGVSESADELTQQLVTKVKRIVEELEEERKGKNEAKQEDLSAHKMAEGKPVASQNVMMRNI